MDKVDFFYIMALMSYVGGLVLAGNDLIGWVNLGCIILLFFSLGSVIKIKEREIRELKDKLEEKKWQKKIKQKKK